MDGRKGGTVNSFDRELLQIRRQRSQQTREQRVSTNIKDYRDGYAAGRLDYIMFRPARDLEGTVGISDLNLRGYKAGYLDASHGRADKFPGHPVPQNFGGSS